MPRAVVQEGDCIGGCNCKAHSVFAAAYMQLQSFVDLGVVKEVHPSGPRE